MERHRIVAAGTVILIVGVIIATGPLVGLSLTTEGEEFEPGNGTMNATVVSTPEKATLEAARYGVERYHLRASSVELRIHDINGQPTVAYDIVINELNHTRSSVTFLGPTFEGAYLLKFESTTLDANRISQEEYRGTLRVGILNGDEIQILAEREISIEVTK